MSTDLTPAGRPGPSRRGSRFIDVDDFDQDLVDSTPFAFGHARGGYSHARPSEAPYGLVALLAQAEWWRPQAGPPIRVVDMTDTHRLHTARFVLNQATALHLFIPEAVKGMPLFVALLTVAPALPLPGAPGWNDLLARAGHWSTCPRNRVLAAPACSPECQPKTEVWDSRPMLSAVELTIDYDGDAAGTDGL